MRATAPIAAAALLGLTAINCLGVRAGSNVQSALMLLKVGAIAALVVAGIAWAAARFIPCRCSTSRFLSDCCGAIGAAMMPVAFAYGGWQTATFVAGEMRDPRRDLSRGLVLGVLGVIAALSLGELRLSARARTRRPGGDADARVRGDARALGERGAQWIAVGIAVSTLGFLSQGILTAPRVYYAMARDGLFFEASAGFRRDRARRSSRSSCKACSRPSSRSPGATSRS